MNRTRRNKIVMAIMILKKLTITIENCKKLYLGKQIKIDKKNRVLNHYGSKHLARIDIGISDTITKVVQ